MNSGFQAPAGVLITNSLRGNNLTMTTADGRLGKVEVSLNTIQPLTR